MILSTNEKLSRRVQKLEKIVHNRNPDSYILFSITDRENSKKIIELKIRITK